jgi:NACHT domain
MKNRRNVVRICIEFIVFILSTIVLLDLSKQKNTSEWITQFVNAISTSGGFIAVFELLYNFIFKPANSEPKNLRKQILDIQKQQWLEQILDLSVGDKLISLSFDTDADFKNEIHQHVKDNSIFDITKFGVTNYSVSDAYCASGQQLVILGDAGSGKTIALLQLFHELHQEAYKRPGGDFPVVFKLGSWASWVEPEELSLENWFLKELEDIFRDTKPSTTILMDFIKARRIIFLLDGFDEVPTILHKSLFDRINSFVRGNDSINHTKFVLTSRVEAFETVQFQDSIKIGKSLKLRDISDVDIEKYLQDKKYKKLRDLIFEPHSKLRNYARLPFILNALAESFESRDIQNLRTALDNESDMVGGTDIKPIPRFILSSFVKQQFNRKTDIANHTDVVDYEREDVIKYLTWIAMKLQNIPKNNQEEVWNGVFVDYLQPTWLKDNKQWLWMYILTSRVFGTIAIVMGIGFFLASPMDYIHCGLIAGLTVGTLDIVVPYKPKDKIPDGFRSLTLGYGFRALLEKLSGTLRLTNLKRLFFLGNRTVTVYLSCSIILSIFLGILIPAPSGDLILGGWVSLTGITLAWFLPLFIATIYTTRNLKIKFGGNDINTVERLKFEIRTFLAYGFRGGIVVGLIVAIFAQSLSAWKYGTSARWLHEFSDARGIVWINPITIGFLIGITFGGIISGIFGLLKITPINITERLRPNQGIRLSIFNAVRVSASLAFIAGGFFGLGLLYYYRDVDGLYRGIRNGLAIGILGGLWYGGLDTIHYIILRFFLFASGCIPWRLTHFLRHCSKLNLMREIGASYCFSHDYLQQYFLSRPDSKIKPQKLSLLIIPIILLAFASFSIVRPVLYQSIYPLSGNIKFKVSKQTNLMTNGQKYYLNAGKIISIQSRGQIFTGHFLGYITPEGTNIGIFGLPIGHIYNVAPDLPNNALICKLDTEQRWQLCAQRVNSFDFPWNERSKKFKASRDGHLIFDINELEVEKRRGSYYVKIE